MKCKNNLGVLQEPEERLSWDEMVSEEGVYKVGGRDNDHKIVVLFSSMKVTTCVIFVTSANMKVMSRDDWNKTKFVKINNKVSMVFS